MKNSWTIYKSNQSAWKAMKASCREAKSSIDIEQYIFRDDFVGREILDILRERSRSGVSVRILVDAVGSRSLHGSSVLKELKADGIKVLFFNPIKPFWVHRAISWFLRDHRKILIVDDKEGHIGGVGIGDWMSSWRDTHAVFTGPIVEQISYAFNQMWNHTEKGEKIFKLRHRHNDTDIEVITNAPRLRQRFIYKELLARIKKAKNYIYFTTPYFIPDGKLFRAMTKAVERGVKIKLLVPFNPESPAFIDAAVDIACQSYFWLAIKRGIEIYRYTPSMMHAKTIVIDDSWATMGSTNLDNLSLLLNYEINVQTENSEFVASLKRDFEEDLRETKQLTRADWRRRPFSQKLLELITWPFHRIM